MIELILFLAALAFVCELIDSGFGMGYGTILSPLLIIFGFNPLVVVPSILISQAFGGTFASFFHHRFKNVNFKPNETNRNKLKESVKKDGFIGAFKKTATNDLKVVAVIIILGVIATIIAVLVAVNIPGWMLKTYIGLLVLAMGLILLSGTKFVFTWKKMIFVGIISSFNKGMSGGGFGPVVTGGQIIAGKNHKNAIGCTTLAEAPICIVSFAAYAIINGFPDTNLMMPLIAGAAIAAPIGAMVTSKINPKKLKVILGVLITLLGVWTLVKIVL